MHYDITAVSGSRLTLLAHETAAWRRYRALAIAEDRMTIEQATRAADRMILNERLAAGNTRA